MRILVIRLSSIGDVLLTTPVINSLREKFYDSEIDFLVMKEFKDAIEGNPNINNIILFDKKKYKGIFGIIKFGISLRKYKYDLIIDLHSKIRSNIIRLFCGGKRKLKYKKRNLITSLLVNLRIIKNRYNESIVRKYYKPLEKIGINYQGEKIEFYFNKESLLKIKQLLEKNNINKYIVLAPGASKETKKWPKEYFAKLGKIINNEFNYKVILIGSKKEYDDLEEIKKEIGENCYNFSGLLNLKESGALLSKAEFAVTNDSGPFHIARGVGTKVYVIFGPTDPKMFEYNEKSILIYGNEKCSSCSLHGDEICPKKHFKCMLNISPEYVIRKIKETV